MVRPVRIGIIPARSGSKRLPGKNLAEVGGLSLVYRAVRSALESNIFDRIVVSTNDIMVRDQALLAFADDSSRADFILDSRPEDLCLDDTRTTDVIDYVLKTYCGHVAETAGEAICLLEPTSPFRDGKLISDTLDKLDGYDSVVTVCQFHFPPQHGVWLGESGEVSEFFPEHKLAAGDTRTQAQRPVYHPNGCVYWVGYDHYLRTRSLFRGRVCGYVMPRDRSVDIDDQTDLDYANFLAAKNGW